MSSDVFEIENQQLDNTINELADGEYKADNGFASAEFYQSGNRVVFMSEGRSFAWQPLNMKYVDESGVEDLLYTVEDAPLEVKANYARYNRSMPDVDDWFIVENNRIKHQILVQGFQRDPMPWLSGNIDFVFGGRMEFDDDLSVVANGLTLTGPFETGGSIELFDAAGNMIFFLPPIVVFDSKIPERASTGGKYIITANDNGVLEFNIAVNNLWISDVERHYPIVIDPTVTVTTGINEVVPQSTARLANGWIIASFHTGIYMTSGTNYFYKSMDNGVTWSQLFFITHPNDGYFHTPHASIWADGNYIIFAKYIGTSSDSGMWFYRIDCTTVSNVDQIANRRSNIALSGQIFLVGADSGNLRHTSIRVCKTADGVYHLFYASHSTSQAIIAYHSSTDSGATWSAYKTAYNISSSNVETEDWWVDAKGNSPILITVSVSKDKLLITSPLIASNINYAGGNTGWGFNIVITPTVLQAAGATGATAVRSGRCVIDSSGVIHLLINAQSGGFSLHILYGKSTNNFNDAISLSLFDSDASSMGIALPVVDYADRISVYYKKTNLYMKQLPSGGSWSSAVLIFFGSSGAYDAPTYVNDTVLLLFIDSVSTNTLKASSTYVNHPPEAPINLARTNFDATQTALCSWSFVDVNPGDVQTAYQIEFLRVSNSAVTDTGKITSYTSSRTLSANYLVNGQQYQWRVRTWDVSNEAGPWSQYASFYTSATPVATITTPATDETVIISAALTAQWTVTDAEGEGQSAYQVWLTNVGDEVLWTSGVVSSVVARSRSIDFPLANNSNYKIKVTVWDAKNIQSLQKSRSFSTSYTPPAVSSLSKTACRGYVQLNITNPAPTGGQPAVAYNEIHRRAQGDINFIRIATNLLLGGSYADYTVASGVVYNYFVRTLASDGSFSQSSITSFGITLDSGVWLHDLGNPAGTIRKFALDGRGRSASWKPELELMKFAGRAMPVAEFGIGEEGSVSVDLDLMRNDGSIEVLRNLARSRSTICYRDGRGRKVFGVITDLPETDERYGYSTKLKIIQLDYTEEV